LHIPHWLSDCFLAVGRLSANSGHSLRHEQRRIVPSNLKSASAHLIASAIGDVPLD
jgi:hypothetical protein